VSAHRRPSLRGLRGQRRVQPGGNRQAGSHRLLPIALGLTLLGVGGVVGPSVVENVAGDNGDRQQISLSALPADAPDQGLVYDGLQPAKAGTLCAGSYALDDETCTSGPDVAPAGLRVRADVAAVTAAAPDQVSPTRETDAVPTDAEIARDEGGSALTADAPALIPDPAPGEADFVIGAHDVACEGDGRSGKRVQVVYLHELGTPSRYTDFLGSIRTWSAGVDQIYDASAAETGGSRHIRFVTTPQCRVDVAEVQVPTKALSSFTATIGALQKLGYNRTDRKYLMFADANVYCGIATYVADDRPGIGNRNNGGPSYGRIDAGCWSSVMAAHELTHTLGAVLNDAPNSSGAGGCVDEYDLLCGKDRSGTAVRTACPKTHQTRLDCGHDDYFSTNPKPGSYLAKNWNIATSEFLLRSDGGDDLPDAVGAVPAPEPTAGAATPAPTVASATPTPTGTADPGTATGGGVDDGGGDAPPTVGATPTEGTGDDQGADPTGTPTPAVTTEPAAAKAETVVATKLPAKSVVQAAPVQAVLEIRDATSSAVHLTWSAASSAATYEVFVDGQPIATTKATRARLIGLKPDAKYQVTVKTGSAYAAKATAETAPAARPAQNSWFILTNALTGGAADLYAARTADATPITLSEGADGDAQQQWQLIPAGNGSYSLMSQATGKCVVPLDGNPVAGAPLVQGACASGNGALWQLQASDYGFTLRTTIGDLVAGVGNQRFGSLRVLVLQDGNGQRHQSWTAVPD
jgi:hypothetical protein